MAETEAERRRIEVTGGPSDRCWHRFSLLKYRQRDTADGPRRPVAVEPAIRPGNPTVRSGSQNVEERSVFVERLASTLRHICNTLRYTLQCADFLRVKGNGWARKRGRGGKLCKDRLVHE